MIRNLTAHESIQSLTLKLKLGVSKSTPEEHGNAQINISLFFQKYTLSQTLINDLMHLC